MRLTNCSRATTGHFRLWQTSERDKLPFAKQPGCYIFSDICKTALVLHTFGNMQNRLGVTDTNPFWEYIIIDRNL